MYPLSRPHAPHHPVQGHFSKLIASQARSYRFPHHRHLKNIIGQLFRVQNRKLTFFYYSAKIENMKYTDWYPQDDPLREATAGGMDKYFNTLLTDKDAPQTNGTPVRGYRFMRIGDDGNLYSPFVHTTQYADQLFSDLPNVSVGTFVDAAPDQPTEFVNKIDPSSINVDPSEQGFYYWPDKDIAEDYMKVFMHHNHYEQSGIVYRAEIITDKETGESSTHVDFSSESEPWKRRTLEEDDRWKRESEGRQFSATYGLFEVEGEAIVKEHADAGFVMQNLKVVGKPLLTVDANQIHRDINNPKMFQGAVKRH